jgi:hypothetical protein
MEPSPEVIGWWLYWILVCLVACLAIAYILLIALGVAIWIVAGYKS